MRAERVVDGHPAHAEVATDLVRSRNSVNHGVSFDMTQALVIYEKKVRLRAMGHRLIRRNYFSPEIRPHVVKVCASKALLRRNS
jgi:hypothetical protein